MRAAIYARKSNDDNDRSDDNKSVARQIDRARAFAEARGWTVDPEHVFTDDGVSGAEFKSRPGLLRLLDRLRDFDVIVMSEQSRLGREQSQTSAVFARIHGRAVRVFCYLTGAELKFDNAVDKFMVQAVAFANEMERELASQRARDALERKARQGYNTGGIVYGYDNVPVMGTGVRDGQPVKSHTDYRINDAQTDVLRRIFRAYAAGYGHVTIAKALNGDPRYGELSRRYFEGLTPPPPRKGSGSWAPSSVRAMLYNDRYVGRVPWGEHRNAYRDGAKKRTRQAEYLKAERPDLRIIDAGLWDAVQERLAAARKTYLRDTDGRLFGRPPSGVESRYLLSGLASCGCCGGSITALGGKAGLPGTARRPIYYYGCSYRQNRGVTVCANGLKARMEEADALVIDRVRDRVLTPEAIDFTIAEAVRLLAEHQRANTDQPERLERALRQERRKLDNFLKLIGEGKAPATVLEEMLKLEASIKEKERELERLRFDAPSELDLARLKRGFRTRLGQFRDLLGAEVPLARQALRKLLDGRIEFAPQTDGRGYELRWRLRLAPLVERGYIEVASPRGFEPRLPP